MKLTRTRRRTMMSAAMTIALFGTAARADVIAISPAAFPGGSTLITFTGIADGVEVNGLVLAGVQFNYSVGFGLALIDGGPGTTNNVSPQNIELTPQIRVPLGTLTILLPSLQNLFGFGFAVLTMTPVANAVTVTLFDGATNVGSLSYNGVPDPDYAGGYAGIRSTLAFNRVQLTFSSVVAPFAVDNIQFASVTTTPEPATVALVLTGLVGVGVLRLRRRGTST